MKITHLMRVMQEMGKSRFISIQCDTRIQDSFPSPFLFHVSVYRVPLCFRAWGLGFFCRSKKRHFLIIFLLQHCFFIEKDIWKTCFQFSEVQLNLTAFLIVEKTKPQRRNPEKKKPICVYRFFSVIFR